MELSLRQIFANFENAGKVTLKLGFPQIILALSFFVFS